MSVSGAALPLVARDAELAALQRTLGDAERGVGRAVCIVGPAGIGKTRLATESLTMAREAGFRCAWGSGWTEPGVPPLWPWQSVLSQLGCGDVGLRPIDEQSEQERFGTFRAVADAIGRAAAEQPVMIVLDDVHSCDPASLLLTRVLVRDLRASRVHLVVTAREPDEVDEPGRAPLAALARDSVLLAPAPLTRDALADLHRLIGRSTSTAVLAELHELTGGNPLFVGELLLGHPSGSTLTVDSVRGILRLRIEGLPADAGAVLAAAAVLGPLASTATVLAVAAVDPVRGEELIAEAERVGVLAPRANGRCAFAHRLLAEAVVAGLAESELAQLHESVADALGRIDATAVEHVVATAHHRVAVAAIRHDETAVVDATGACRMAACSLVAGLAYEAASQLLSRAVELHERYGPRAPDVLLLEVARTELAAGNLLGARAWFRRVAERTDDAVHLAEAAVGLGGIWVHEHRSAADHAAFMALLRQALERLGDDRPDLVVRLRVRLACELAYTGHASADDARAAVELARCLGQPFVLAEALSLWHHTMLGPAGTTVDRLAIADELIAVAVAAGDELLGLMGLLWRAIDLLLLGDQRAERALAEVRMRADALQVGAVLFVLDAIDVMRLLREGRMGPAEEAARRCSELGFAIGDADAVGYLGGHLLTIRWLQLRPHEIVPLARNVAASPTLVEGDVAPRAAAAVLGAMMGDDEPARVDLGIVMDCLPRSERTSSNFLVTLFCAAEAASLLDDPKTAEWVYATLLPYRHLPIMGSVGVVCFGSAERTLGVAARTLGDVNLAVHHFEQALEQNRRLPNRVMAAICEGELGCALIERACDGDVDRGAAHVRSARSALAGFGLGEREDALRDHAARLLRTAPPPDGEIVRTPDGWRLGYGRHAAELVDSIGVRRLVHLLEHPGIDVPAAQLAGAGERTARQMVNDEASLRAYRDRIDELRSEIDAADHDHDLARASARRADLDELLEHVAPSIGLAGRSRVFSDTGERARVAVRKSLGRVFDAIARQDAELARQLSASVHTGAICRFDPAGRFPSVWRTSSLV